MGKQSVSAWTDASGKSFPEYLNFSRDGDEAVIIMREAPFLAMNGNTASVRMPWAEFVAMCGAVVAAAQ